MNSKILITPFVSAYFNGCEVFLGQKRELIRKNLKFDYNEFNRNIYSENSSDHYLQLGTFIEYDTSNFCSAIEFTNNSSIFLDKVDLMQLKYSKLRSIFDILSSKYEVEEDYGVTYFDLGFGAYKSRQIDMIESLIIFSKNY